MGALVSILVVCYPEVFGRLMIFAFTLVGPKLKIKIKEIQQTPKYICMQVAMKVKP
jgi:hypothetical protein